MNNLQIKIGFKKAGSYIDYIKHNPADNLEIMARGLNTSKAIYVSAVLKDLGYIISDFDIEAKKMDKKEPLAVLKIKLRAKDGYYDKG